jgi:hypothetical protein
MRRSLRAIITTATAMARTSTRPPKMNIHHQTTTRAYWNIHKLRVKNESFPYRNAQLTTLNATPSRIANLDQVFRTDPGGIRQQARQSRKIESRTGVTFLSFWADGSGFQSPGRRREAVSRDTGPGPWSEPAVWCAESGPAFAASEESFGNEEKFQAFDTGCFTQY